MYFAVVLFFYRENALNGASLCSHLLRASVVAPAVLRHVLAMSDDRLFFIFPGKDTNAVKDNLHRGSLSDFGSTIKNCLCTMSHVSHGKGDLWRLIFLQCGGGR